MHFSFIPYGKRDLVEKLLRDMEAQKHALIMTKDGKEKTIWIDSQIRIVPGGIIEYVCPKEDINLVLNTLGANQKVPYGMGKILSIVRKVFKYKKIPKYSDDRKFLWNREHVSILPIGIREDGELVGELELDKGWTHEAI